MSANKASEIQHKAFENKSFPCTYTRQTSILIKLQKAEFFILFSTPCITEQKKFN